MTTYTNVHFTPLNPKVEDVRIADIAHALSLMTRANGHVKRFYSVAQHSVNCAHEARDRGFSNKIQLACLLHDASEAYIADMIRPVKQEFPAYREIENKLQDVINQAFGIDLTLEEQALVKDIDDALLWHEFAELMNGHANVPEPVLHSNPDLSERGFISVEQEFLRLFESLI
ncbi:MAG: phosphohydrolase [Defluviitaleaceae bacterium]|nr:phosphohydrolase [Defluviitaleaceae bacterium]MCL2836622.1 phosphohydrolase [Defluviitaleaceae bacterium]